MHAIFIVHRKSLPLVYEPGCLQACLYANSVGIRRRNTRTLNSSSSRARTCRHRISKCLLIYADRSARVRQACVQGTHTMRWVHTAHHECCKRSFGVLKGVETEHERMRGGAERGGPKSCLHKYFAQCISQCCCVRYVVKICGHSLAVVYNYSP